MPSAAEQAGLVEMDMRVDEAGQGEPAADIDLGPFAGKPGLDGSDTSTRDADIDRSWRGPSPGVAEDQVEGRFRVHGSEQAGAGPNLAEERSPGSSRLCAVSRLGCSKYVHALQRADCSIVHQEKSPCLLPPKPSPRTTLSECPTPRWSRPI